MSSEIPSPTSTVPLPDPLAHGFPGRVPFVDMLRIIHLDRRLVPGSR
jgi:hypothetical protein